LLSCSLNHSRSIVEFTLWIDQARFGKATAGQSIDAASFESKAGELVTIRLPRRSWRTRIRRGSRVQAGGDSTDALLQVQASLRSRAKANPNDGPLITAARDKQREGADQALAKLRCSVSPVLCFAGMCRKTRMASRCGSFVARRATG